MEMVLKGIVFYWNIDFIFVLMVVWQLFYTSVLNIDDHFHAFLRQVVTSIWSLYEGISNVMYC